MVIDNQGKSNSTYHPEKLKFRAWMLAIKQNICCQKNGGSYRLHSFFLSMLKSNMKKNQGCSEKQKDSSSMITFLTFQSIVRRTLIRYLQYQPMGLVDWWMVVVDHESLTKKSTMKFAVIYKKKNFMEWNNYFDYSLKPSFINSL